MGTSVGWGHQWGHQWGGTSVGGHRGGHQWGGHQWGGNISGVGVADGVVGLPQPQSPPLDEEELFNMAATLRRLAAIFA